MKTSKIIFITLLSTIAFFILSAAMDIRINGVRRGDFRANFKVNKQTIPSFGVLYLNNSKNVELVQNDSSYIVITSMKDSITPQINYSIKADTLMISDFEKMVRRHVSISIHSTDSLKRIKLNNSDIRLEKFRTAKLFIELDKSSIWFDQNGRVQPSFHYLDIVAKNHSRVYTNRFNVDSLGIDLQNSEANLEIIAGKMNGTLTDHSRIYARQPAEISIKRDATSKVNLNDY